MPPLARVAVYCGSSFGARATYADAAQALGATLADRGVGLVYGGAGIGLMGALADAVARAGGDVIGVIPRALVDREIAHTGLADLRVVGSMHERKALMTELADAFVALPGGMGTLDELAEAITWGQLGIHQKPCGLLDVEGYYAGFLSFLDHGAAEGFLRPEHRDALVVETDPDELLDRLEAASGIPAKWAGDPPRP
jgi:uncharacterized protein (TIGR00730 family)